MVHKKKNQTNFQLMDSIQLHCAATCYIITLYSDF